MDPRRGRLALGSNWFRPRAAAPSTALLGQAPLKMCKNKVDRSSAVAAQTRGDLSAMGLDDGPAKLMRRGRTGPFLQEVKFADCGTARRGDDTLDSSFEATGMDDSHQGTSLAHDPSKGGSPTAAISLA